MKNRIKAAYDGIQPDESRFDVIYSRIRTECAVRTAKRFPLRRVCTVGICIAVAAALTGLGFAAYQKWSLPDPTVYTPTPDMGVYQIKESHTYTAPATSVPVTTTPSAAASTVTATAVTTTTAQSSVPAALTDEDFIRKAVDILHLVGLEDVQSEQLTVVRQKQLYWNRNEVEVYFTEDENHSSVRFFENSGELLGLNSIDWAIDDAAVCNSYDEAAELATRYYEALPIPQGYTLTGCDRYDEQYWSFSFCREVQEGVYSWYEAAKIAVNPQTGRLTGCSTFYTPLLDDHEPGDIPLTAEQAEEIARSCEHVNLEKHELESCELTVVLPNWWFTDKMADSLNAQSCDVTRLGWTLKFENKNSDFADIITLFVDYYTGEILGGDMT